MKRTFFTLMLLGLGLGAAAQELQTLREYLEAGLERNYDIRIIRNEERISDNNATAANAGKLPTIDLSAGYTGRLDNDRTTPRGGDPVTENGIYNQTFDVGLAVNWTLFDGFRIRAEYAKLEELKAKGALQTRLTIEDFIASFTAEYYNFVQQKLRLGNYLYAMALSRERLRIAEEWYRVGSSARLDVLQARVDFNADSSQYMSQQEAVTASRIRLTNRDLEILEKEFPEVDEVAANSWLSSKKLAYGGNFMEASLRGSLPKVARIEGIKIAKGRFINEADIREYRKSALIDEETALVLFQGADPLGKFIRVDSLVFKVVGVTKGDAMRNSATCIIPLTTGQLVYKANEPYINDAIITVKEIRTDREMEEFERRIKGRLAAEHDFDPTDDSAIWINNTMERVKDMMIVFGGINLFVWIIGLGTLLAGVVGVSNIMLVTVSERTAEFGIRKALGAKPRSIIRLILTESVMITAAFGYMGMVLGVAVMEAVNYYMTQTPADASETGFAPTIFLDPTLNLGVAVSATVVLIVAGIIAGYVPAYRAAQLKTIDALRYNK